MIAQNVIQAVLAAGGLPSISDLLNYDIGTATSQFHVTYGGWGGSFFYWNETPTTQSSTVGQQITAALPSGSDFDGGGLYDQFVATNGGAIADNLQVSTVGTLLQAEQTYVKGAELPPTNGLQLFGRAIDIQQHGVSIVGDPNNIDYMHYNTYTKEWYSDYSLNSSAQTIGLIPSSALITDPTMISSLNQEQTYRAAHQGVAAGSNDNLAIPKSSPSMVANDYSGLDSGTVVYGDGSYSTTTVDNGDAGQYGASIVDRTYSTDGSLVMAVSTTDSSYADAIVDLYNHQGVVVAEEDIMGAYPGNIANQTSVVFTDFSSAWTSDRIQFLPGTQTVGSLGLINSDGSSLIYSGGNSDGSWEETLVSSDGSVDYISYGNFYNPSQRKDVFETIVSSYPSGGGQHTVTTYAAGDPNAPSRFAGTTAPTDYASAQELWGSLIGNALATSSVTPANRSAASSVSKPSLPSFGAAVVPHEQHPSWTSIHTLHSFAAAPA